MLKKQKSNKSDLDQAKMARQAAESQVRRVEIAHEIRPPLKMIMATILPLLIPSLITQLPNQKKMMKQTLFRIINLLPVNRKRSYQIMHLPRNTRLKA